MTAMFILPNSCENNKEYSDPIQHLIIKNKAAPNFTILLYDMEKTGVFSKSYKQRYRVLKDENGKVVAKDSEWFPVNSAQYNQHESNIGMEVAAKNDSARIKRVVGPPGYTNYIGNPTYGYWTEGINDTIIIKEKMKDTTLPVAHSAYYDHPRKSTIIIEGISRINLSRLPRNLVIDTVYAKASSYRKDFGSAEQSALGERYYWQFYPNYDYLRALLQLPTGKIILTEHQDARRHYHRGYSYYGILLMGGNRRYGTYSNYTSGNSAGRRFSRGGGGFGK